MACLVIALHHYAQNILVSGDSDNIIWHALSAQGGYSGVALFFFLSGYGLAESEQKQHLSVPQFIKKRFWKVYEPVLIINLITWICYQSVAFAQSEMWNDIPLASVFLVDYLDYYFWFVAILFVCYAFFPLYGHFRDKSAHIIVLVASTALVIIVLFLCKVSVNHWISIPFFTLGVLFSEQTDWFKRNQVRLLYWLSITFLLVLCICIARILHAPAMLHLAINITQTVILLFVVSKWAISLPTIAICEISYPIYLIHHKIIDSSLFFGHLIPWWLFIFITLYLGWLLHKTNNMVRSITSRVFRVTSQRNSIRR